MNAEKHVSTTITVADAHTNHSRPRPTVRNNTRIVVGFPFSSVHVEEDTVTQSELARLVALLSRALADSAPAETFKGIAEAAEDLTAELGITAS